MRRFASSLAKHANPCALRVTRQGKGPSLRQPGGHHERIHREVEPGSGNVPRPPGIRDHRAALGRRHRLAREHRGARRKDPRFRIRRSTQGLRLVSGRAPEPREARRFRHRLAEGQPRPRCLRRPIRPHRPAPSQHGQGAHQASHQRDVLQRYPRGGITDLLSSS